MHQLQTWFVKVLWSKLHTVGVYMFLYAVFRYELLKAITVIGTFFDHLKISQDLLERYPWYLAIAQTIQ